MSVSARASRSAIFAVAVALLLGFGLVFSFSTRAEPYTTKELPQGMLLTAPEISGEITGALREVHEKLSQDVKPEQNAAVWLMHIYGEDALDQPLHDVTFEMLGIKSLSPASPLFVPMDAFVKTLDGVPPGEVELQAAILQDEMIQAGDQVWTKETWPRLADYLAANEKALAALTLAAEQPHYYAPLLAPEEPSRLMSASLVIERRLPFLVRMLAARALLRFGNHDLPGCISDLMSCQRLAYLLATGSPFDVSVAKAQVMDSIAFQAERALLASGRMSQEQLSEFRKAYAALPVFPPAATAADIGERAIIHQEIELLQTDEDTKIGFFEDDEHKTEDKSQIKSLAASNWKLALQRADEVHGKIVEALATKDRAAQNAKFEKLDQEYAAWEGSVDDKTRHFSEAIKKDLPGTSRWIGENMAMSLRPNYRQRRYSEDREQARRDLITVGLALEACQREQGDFPATLENLVPKYLPSVPMDPCTDGPFVYVRQGAGEARLLSLGTNQRDDAGQQYNDDVELKLK